MNAERIARLVVCALLLGVPVAVFGVPHIAPAAPSGSVVDIHGTMAESGGWTPASFTATAGETVHLRLTSDDVMHGFAIGKSDSPAVDVEPGKVTELDVRFDHPGSYVFYCTRWCGPNHWRMRGTIDVTGAGERATPAPPPLYVTLGLDIDAPHPAAVVPDARPSAARGAALGVGVPAPFLTRGYYRAHSPADAWSDLRAQAFTEGLSDAQVWDLAARGLRANTTPADLEAGAALFAANCAACHGESGQGDGVMAASRLSPAAGGTAEPGMLGHEVLAPANFTDRAAMLGASPALLQGKILRGGMGTGMPSWGPILTEAQSWLLVHYLQSYTIDQGP